MGTDDASREPRVVAWFAIASLVAFAVIGGLLSLLAARTVRRNAEEMAVFHARFVIDSVLAPMFEGVDLSEPVRGAEYERIRSLVERSVISARDVRVKVWAPDGTIVFSDLPALVGRRFPEEVPELREVLAGALRTELTDLGEPEERAERPIASRLFATYAPLRPAGTGPPVAVGELYQDADVVRGEVDPLLFDLWLGLGAGLVVLYLAIIPIAVRTSRELRHRNEHLREQAARLAGFLAREQEAVERLRELNRAKDDLVAAASHELRTPLTSILGYVRTLRRPGAADDPSARDEFLRAIERQADRLSRLVRNLLAAAELERGDRPVEPSTFDVGALVAAAVEALPEAAGRVRLDVPPGLPLVESDAGRLAHVVENLVENALKYSPGGGEVEVAVRAEGGWLRIRVRDGGVGIDPRVQDRVYEPFFQADQSATRRFGGLGLGLHVVRGTVEQLGGRVAFASHPGLGTTVSVSIPLRPGAASPPGSSADPAGAGASRHPVA
ncbi:MAG TPA: HAMP domain-containing sensor histidine kinase [Actinomycetota bacterium]|nr:HAMP domain-containing sensor histidine kinase [Actinomycetota bacterium]